MRLVYENGSIGPLRTVQAGTGYRSQNSPIQVLGTAGIPIQIEITWFDGKQDSVVIEQDLRSYEITYEE